MISALDEHLDDLALAGKVRVPLPESRTDDFIRVPPSKIHSIRSLRADHCASANCLCSVVSSQSTTAINDRR